jgi:SAM-dependent methyltransferase
MLKLDIPENTCQYEMFDPKTLDPLNDSTIIRLIETGWDDATFRGKTVLDIGCNSGALSIFAVKNGASAVKAVDVQQPLVDFVSSVVAEHKFPISVEKAALSGLTVERHRSDVVLCMEVLHWIVHQGGTISEAVAKLAALTNESLFIETPWDVNEPSIRFKQDYPKDEYDIEKIVTELARHFEDVRFRRFMTYFGEMKDSKRVLIEARNKRSGSLGARHIKDANLTGIALGGGRNEAHLVSARSGLKVLKVLGRESALLRLDDGTIAKLGDFLSAPAAREVLVGPQLLGDSYLKIEEDGHAYMLFPFVGHLQDYYPERRTPAPAKSPIKAAAKLVTFLSGAPQEIIKQLRAATLPPKPANLNAYPDNIRKSLQVPSRARFIALVNERIAGYDRLREDTLIHNDLQLANFVAGADGQDYIVDIDLIRSGPLYADLLTCCVYLGMKHEDIAAAYADLRPRLTRDCDMLDVAFAAATCLMWLNARSKIGPALHKSQLKIFLTGLDGLADFASKLE